MRRLLPSRLNSGLFSPSQRRRAWMALWAQDRRRGRGGAEPEPPAGPSLLDGLLAYWPLDEAGTGTRADALGLLPLYEFEYPDVPQIDVVYSMPGVLGNGARPEPEMWNFGLTPWVQVVDVTQDFSVSFWFWRAEGGGGSHLFGVEPCFLITCGAGDDANNGFSAFLWTDEWAAEVVNLNSTTTVPFDTWAHCVVVREGGTLKLYQDGVLADSDPLVGTPAAVTGFLRIGPSWWGYIWGYEAFDEVGVWQRALSASEVGQLYNGGSGLAYELF